MSGLHVASIACSPPKLMVTPCLRKAIPGAAISTLELDLADLSSVRAAANRWLDSGKELDVLLNNAGGWHGSNL